MAIDAIRPGDLVLSRDEHTGAQMLRRVARTMVHQSSELVHIRTDADTLTATPNHPFWIQGRGWIDAGSLAPGDTLVLADGERARIVSVTHETLAAPVNVYNLEVEDYHTYFVASVGVWVHNCGGAPTEITELSDHAWNRMLDNPMRGGQPGPGMSTWAVRDVVANPSSSAWQPDKATWLLQNSNGTVAINAAGRVATVIPTGGWSAGWGTIGP